MKIYVKEMLNSFLFTLSCIIIFTGYFTIKGDILQCFILSIIAVITLLITKIKKIRIQSDSLIWGLLLVLMTLSLTYTIDFNTSVKYITYMWLLFVFKICIDNISNFKKIVLKLLYIFSSIHVLSTILYLIVPTFIQSIVSRILPLNRAAYNISLYKYGAIAGICSDHGINAIFITVFILLSFSNLLEKKSVKNLLLTACGIIGLLLTGKRGHLIANLAALLSVFIIYNKNNKKLVKNIIFISIFGLLLIFLVSKIPSASFIFERFNQLSQEGNILNGRDDLYAAMISSIKSNFIFGTGIRTTILLTGGNDGHNIFLQVLTEIGVLGLITIIIILLKNLKKAINILNEKKSIYKCSSLYYQIFFFINGLTGNPLYLISTLILYFIFTSDNYLIESDGETN